MIYGANIIQSSYIYHELNKSYRGRGFQPLCFTLHADALQMDAEQTPKPTLLASRNLNASKRKSQESACWRTQAIHPG